jgi:hypothetical protein
LNGNEWHSLDIVFVGGRRQKRVGVLMQNGRYFSVKMRRRVLDISIENFGFQSFNRVIVLSHILEKKLIECLS